MSMTTPQLRADLFERILKLNFEVHYERFLKWVEGTEEDDDYMPWNLIKEELVKVPSWQISFLGGNVPEMDSLPYTPTALRTVEGVFRVIHDPHGDFQMWEAWGHDAYSLVRILDCLVDLHRQGEFIFNVVSVTNWASAMSGKMSIPVQVSYQLNDDFSYLAGGARTYVEHLMADESSMTRQEIFDVWWQRVVDIRLKLSPHEEDLDDIQQETANDMIGAIVSEQLPSWCEK